MTFSPKNLFISSSFGCKNLCTLSPKFILCLLKFHEKKFGKSSTLNFFSILYNFYETYFLQLSLTRLINDIKTSKYQSMFAWLHFPIDVKQLRIVVLIKSQSCNNKQETVIISKLSQSLRQNKPWKKNAISSCLIGLRNLYIKSREAIFCYLLA